MEDESDVYLDGTTTPTSSSGVAVEAEQPPTKRHKNKPSTPSSISTKGRGVCRIEVTRVEWNPIQPWQKLSQSKSTGTAFVIANERLLTNAHVVKSAIDIRVRLFGSTRRFPARVLVYAPDVDLALLELLGGATDFFATATKSTTAEEDQGRPIKKQRKEPLALEFATELPALQETVHVVGYPTGGKTICMTEGVVSRIDVRGSTGGVVIQVDSAINPGNSGGPALNAKGQVTGVASRKMTKSGNKGVDNIGYLIPSIVVQAFLGRVHATGDDSPEKQNHRLPDYEYTILSSIPYRWHSLENKSLRLAHQVPESVHGILITSVCESVVGTDEDSLKQGDILTTIDGVSVADDGQVVLRGDELIQHAYLLKIKLLQEPLQLQVFRNGKTITCRPIILSDIPSIVPRWDSVDCHPNYLILGACVLLPFTHALRHYNRCGSRLKADCMDWCRKWPSEWQDKEGLVVLTDILAHELTFSYQRPWRRVVSYNGVSITSLNHLKLLWEASCQEAQKLKETTTSPAPTFARLQLENDDDIVFEVSAAIQAQTEVMKTYEIPKSHQILPSNPHYK